MRCLFICVLKYIKLLEPYTVNQNPWYISSWHYRIQTLQPKRLNTRRITILICRGNKGVRRKVTTSNNTSNMTSNMVRRKATTRNKKEDKVTATVKVKGKVRTTTAPSDRPASAGWRRPEITRKTMASRRRRKTVSTWSVLGTRGRKRLKLKYDHERL